jgi:hypothetical protein
LVNAGGAGEGRFGGRGGREFAGESQAVDVGMSMAEGVKKAVFRGGRVGRPFIVIEPTGENVVEGPVALVS